MTYKTQIEPNKPRNKKEFLSLAIGKKITEIERFFVTRPDEFIEENNECRKDRYFSLCHGASQFWFDKTLTHSFIFYSASTPILIYPQLFYEIDSRIKYQLSRAEDLSSPKLRDCLGETCIDVRIWTYSETEHEIRSEKDEGSWTHELAKEYDKKNVEITESGISYYLSNGVEIIYCCNLYDDDLSDRLLFVEDINQSYVYACYSLLQDKYIVNPKELNLLN
jgi:hypothetical protein